MLGGAYHNTQIVSCAIVQKLQLIMQLVHGLRNILSYYEVSENTGVEDHLDCPLNPPLVNKRN